MPTAKQTAGPLRAFEEALGKQIDLAEPFATEVRDPDPLAETWEELISSQAALSADIETFAAEAGGAGPPNWKQRTGSAPRATMPHCMRRAKACTTWPNAAGT